MDAKIKTCRTSRGFTLVEMLIVIVIIAVLAGLITTAAVNALRAAKRFTIRSEIEQLTMALEKYKQEHGDYPPDFAGLQGTTAQQQAAQDAVLRHLRKAYPRYALTGNTAQKWLQFRRDVKRASTADATVNEDNATGTEVNNLDPASALAFWLGGPGDTSGSGSTKLVGFSANPANPFAIRGSRLPTLFEFDETRLENAGTDVSPVYRYIPSNMPTTPSAGATKAPYVYFRANPGAAPGLAYDPLVASFPQPTTPAIPIDTGTCVPYASAITRIDATKVQIDRWFNDKTYQIISAGLDGEFSDPPGQPRYIPPDGDIDHKGRFLDVAKTESNLSTPEEDNLTSFTKGTLGDEVK